MIGMLCIALVALVGVTGAGLLSVLHLWHRHARTQLALDRCVAQTSEAARSDLASIEAGDRRIRAIRLSLTASLLAPPARATLQSALQLAWLHQESKLASFRLRQARWLARLGCARDASLALPIAPIPITRGPPDALGPQPLRWLDPDPRFHFQLSSPPRHSRAELKRARSRSNPMEGISRDEQTDWSLAWRAPARLPGR